MVSRNEVFDPTRSADIRRAVTFEDCDVFEKHLWESITGEVRDEYVDFIEVEHVHDIPGSSTRYNVTYAGDIDALVVALNSLAMSAPDDSFHDISNQCLNRLETELEKRDVFD